MFVLYVLSAALLQNLLSNQVNYLMFIIIILLFLNIAYLLTYRKEETEIMNFSTSNKFWPQWWPTAFWLFYLELKKCSFHIYLSSFILGLVYSPNLMEHVGYSLHFIFLIKFDLLTINYCLELHIAMKLLLYREINKLLDAISVFLLISSRIIRLIE